MSFRFDNLKRLGNRISIAIPKDDDGYLGRECPEAECESYFKIRPGTGLTGTDLPCHCPYCGHTGPHDTFWTKEQLAYAKSVALRQVTDALRKDLKSLEFNHKPRGASGIGISMKLQHGPPLPIRYYREQSLETAVSCEACTLDYSVFGVFAYCPDCRVHNSLQILRQNLSLTRKQLDLAESLDDVDLRRHLVEDALENCVSAFDGFGREACRVRASQSSHQAKAEALSFQNLQRASERLKQLFGVDLAAALLASEWHLAQLGFFRRHLLAHRAGVIDAQYVSETGEPTQLLGRRIAIAASDVRRLAELVEALGVGLVARLPPP